MDFMGDSGSIDNAKFIEYIQKNFSKDLKQMLDTKEELVKRQGALSAVDQTHKLKADAEKMSADAKEAADNLMEKVKEKKKASYAKEVELTARESALLGRESDFEVAVKCTQDDLTAREAKVNADRAALDKLSATLNDQADMLKVAQASLDERVKAFQAKVAALTA